MHEKEIKKQIAEYACSFVHSGMVIGLGTGTTAAAFIEELAKKKLDITCVATSQASEKLGLDLGLRVVPPNQISTIDITFDGTDEIDLQKRLIKGAGGALVREKIVAHASNELIVLADTKKHVPLLGKAALPVEIIPFGCNWTIRALIDLGYHGALRHNPDRTIYTTDNHNYIFDIHFDALRVHPEKDEEKIRSIPGVVDTGFFFNMTGRVILGSSSGISIIEP